MDIVVQVHSFGCKVNSYDAGLLAEKLREKNFSLTHSDSIDGSAQTHIINSCAVTAEATRQAQHQAKVIRSRNPNAFIVMTGCAAQVDTEKFQVPGIDLLVANSHKLQIPQLLEDHFAQANPPTKDRHGPKIYKSNIFKKNDLEMGGGIESRHTRSFLKIQDGCNSFCSYCIIPFARGKSRSVEVSSIVHRINELVDIGYQEVVLTGVHIADYDDHGKGLEYLVEKILKLTQIRRLRLTSLDPGEVTDSLLDLFSDGRICPHFHLSIQSGSSPVLRAMRRNYDGAAVSRVLNQIHGRFPSAFVGMDVIAGFPTETETHFVETLDLLNSHPWTRLHVFPYSERSGTKAMQFAPISIQVRRERAERLRSLGWQRLLARAKQQLGTTKEVIVLNQKSKSAELRMGLSEDYWTVRGISVRDSEKTKRVVIKDLAVRNKTDVHLIAEQ